MSRRATGAAVPGGGVLAAILLVAVGIGACGGGPEPGEPGPPPPPPDLAGIRVMVLPARPGEPPALDRELTFWLTSRAPATDWVLPPEVERAVERAPASGFDLAAYREIVDVGGGRLRVNDPLYGDLRRLGAILDAPMALVPLGTGDHADSLGVTVRLTAALVSIRGGRVVWMHTVTGGPADSHDTAVAAAAETLARTLIPGEG